MFQDTQVIIVSRHLRTREAAQMARAQVGDQFGARRRPDDLGRHRKKFGPPRTGVHHRGALESVIYPVRGKARMRWGEHLEFVAEAEAGDFIFVPPYVPHQEINANSDETLECVLVRSDNEAVVVNLDIEPVEKPEAVYWVDPIHEHP